MLFVPEIAALAQVEGLGTVFANEEGMNEPSNPERSSVDEIRAQAEATKWRVKETTRELLDRLRGGGRDKVEKQKQVAASHFEIARDAVRDAAIRLRSDDQEVVAKPLSHLADSVGKLGYFLQTTSPEEFAAKGAETVRRHPAATLGAAFLAGLAVARVIRASTH